MRFAFWRKPRRAEQVASRSNAPKEGQCPGIQQNNVSLIRAQLAADQAQAGPAINGGGLAGSQVGNVAGSPIGHIAVSQIGDHCHIGRAVGPGRTAALKLLIATILLLAFTIAEFWGGHAANSLAILSEAVHLFSDIAALVIAWISIWIGSKPAFRLMTFGWHRAEMMGALATIGLIWSVTGVLLLKAYKRLINEEEEAELQSDMMLIWAFMGVIVNISTASVLHQRPNRHRCHRGAQNEHRHRGNHHSINVRAAFIHTIGDLLHSVGVLVAAIVIYYKPEWDFIDPICTIVLSFLILLTTFPILNDVLIVLMEGKPKEISFKKVLTLLKSVDGVQQVHDLRIWALSADKPALSAHLAIHEGKDPFKILEDTIDIIRSKYAIAEMTIQVEPYKCSMDDCVQCKLPEERRVRDFLRKFVNGARRP